MAYVQPLGAARIQNAKILFSTMTTRCTSSNVFQEQSSEPSLHGGGALHRCVLAATPRPAVHSRPHLRPDRPHLGRVLPPRPQQPHHPAAGLAWFFFLVLFHHLLPQLRLQHAPAPDLHPCRAGTSQHRHCPVPRRCHQPVMEIIWKGEREGRRKSLLLVYTYYFAKFFGKIYIQLIEISSQNDKACIVGLLSFVLIA